MTQSMDWMNDIKKWDAEWQNIEAAQGGQGSSVPDGTYVAEIADVFFENSKKSGKLLFVWDFSILEGEYTGENVRKFSGVETVDNLRFWKGDLATVGIYLQKPSDINLAEFIGRRVEITVKTKKRDDGEFRNVYINKLIALPEGAVPAPQARQGDFLAGVEAGADAGPFA